MTAKCKDQIKNDNKYNGKEPLFLIGVGNIASPHYTGVMTAEDRSRGATGEPGPFRLTRPARHRVPFVYNAPHSGTYYPPEMLAQSRLPLPVLRSSEDSFADRMFAAAPDHGAPLLRANYARAFVDTNRSPDEIDPTLFDGQVDIPVNTRSERVQAGLGVIPAVVTGGKRIYGSRLPASEATHRINRIYTPHHDQLRALLRDTYASFGCTVLIDCHSMPSGATLGRNGPRQFSDIVLGNVHGQSCAPVIAVTAAETLRNLGYRVALNTPYAGGYNTRTYGRPDAGCHALQVEINRALYMDEARFEPTDGFETVARHMEQLIEALHAIPVQDLARQRPAPLAAE